MRFDNTPPACDPEADFGPISSVFSGDLTADGLTLSVDELTAYVSRKESSSYDLYTTTRASKNAPWGPLTALSNLNSGGDERAPRLSEGGLELYFWRKASPASDGNLWVASRSSIGDPFGSPTSVTAMNSGAGDEDPFFILGGSRLFFTSDRPTGERDLWSSVRISGVLTTPTKMLVVNTSVDWEEERRPVLTRDGLTLYFHSDRAGWNADTDGDIWIAERTSISSDFGAPALVAGLNGSDREFPVELSRDGCTLYFASNRDTSGGSGDPFRLYQSRRGITCAGVQIDDGNPCTVDQCDAVAGVTHVPVPNGTPCADADVCDGSEVCVEATCVAGTPLEVDDDNPCTNDICLPESGVQHLPVATGTPCLDGNVCNGSESCDASGQCQSGIPLDTDDGNPCTVDACDPVSGVTHTPRPQGTSCADEDPCDGEETCSSQAQCLGVAPEPLPLECQEDPPVSTHCGDALRDPVTEECDDGPGTGLDACTADCRVTDAPVAPLPRIEGERRSRALGYGRHPLASSAQAATLVTYTELNDSASALRGAVFLSRGQPSSLIDLGAGARPSEYADASVAAVSSNVFVVAWNELGFGSLDVGLRRVTLGEPLALGDVVLANSTLPGAQQDPDILWTGSELVVAWSSDFVIQARRFDAQLAPLAAEQQLGFSNEVSGSVSLARFGTEWAAAWRTTDETGFEQIRVHTGAASWVIGPFLPGASLERPAVVELDSGHLLVVFSEGSDPLATGTPSVTRLRGAVLNVAAPGPAGWFTLEGSVEPYASDQSIAQARPTLARVGTRLFVGWESEGLAGSELSSEVWLQELAWSGGSVIASTPERPIQVTLARDGAQHAPAFVATPLVPEGALALAFEQHAEAWPYGSRPDVIFGLRPVPFVTLP